MSDSGDKSSLPNGSSLDPMQRLSSFKTPRDLSLGGVKPNKKIFAPNLKVSRNKSKGGLPTVTRDKRDNDKGKKDKKNDKNKNFKNGPSIIKSTGVFSEGLGATARPTTRQSYGRDVDTAPTLQKPTIRVKDVWKIDKELEEQNIRKAFTDTHYNSDEETEDHIKYDKDAPIKLPMSDGGWLHSKPKATIQVKQEIVVKQEPKDDLDLTPLAIDDKSAPVVKKEAYEDTDIVSLLQGDKPTLIMLQFPDTLPGRGRSEEDDSSARRKQGNGGEATSSGDSSQAKDDTPKPKERCRLSDLEEGKIGKLLIHRSGRVRLALGDTMFEVAPGTQASFRQEVVSMVADDESRSANIVALGCLPHKLNLLPHWESLLCDVPI